MLTNLCGVRKNQTGTASRTKKKNATSAAGKNRKRMGEAWIKMTNAATNARTAATPAPLQPDAYQPVTMTKADKIPHPTQTSEAINGSLTKRKKYSPLCNFPIRVINGSVEWDNRPTTPCGPLGKIMHFSR